MKKIEDETKFVLESLSRINEAAKNDIIDKTKRDEQSKRIDSIIQKFNQGITVEESFNLANESFGGSFGMLREDSKLLYELRKHNELVMKLSASIKKKILSENLVHQKFQSNPLVEYEERHGGPLWFEISLILLEFKDESLVEIILDKSLSKRMSPQKDEKDVITCKYKTIVVQSQYITGQIEFNDGRKFHFESLYGNMEYIYLEHPQIWKESIVLKRKPA
jgi:ribosomal protein L21E